MKVAVIGASGGMGGFFVRYFLHHGHSVTGSDSKKMRFKHPKFSFARSNAEATSGADVVLIATPMETTVEVFGEVSRAARKGALVVEIASVKQKILKQINSSGGGRTRLLSIHPLFGPSLKDGEMKLVVIETKKDSLSTARSLFPDATLVPMKAADHDRAMGVILSLTHLLNIAYAGTVSRYLSPNEFRKLETPTSSVQLTLAEGVLSQSPSLYSRIQLENPHSVKAAKALIAELSRLVELVEKGDAAGFEKRFAELSRIYSGDSSSAMERVYQAFDKSPKP